jgi:hypothetical protein
MDALQALDQLERSISGENPFDQRLLLPAGAKPL